MLPCVFWSWLVHIRQWWTDMWRMIFNILILIISPGLFISTLPYLPHIALFDVKVVAPQVTVRHNRDPVIYGWWCGPGSAPRVQGQVAGCSVGNVDISSGDRSPHSAPLTTVRLDQDTMGFPAAAALGMFPNTCLGRGHVRVAARNPQ